MLLAIDASRAAEPQKTGVGWYTHHLIAHLRDVIPHDVRVLLYSDAPLPKELQPLPSSWTERALRWRPLPFWSQLRCAWQVFRDRPDVLFVPAHVIPDAVGFAAFLARKLTGPAAADPHRARWRSARGAPRGPGARGLASLDIAPPVSPARSHAGGSSLRLDPPLRVTRQRPLAPKLITTIHDVAFRAFPEAYALRERWYADHASRIAVRAADRIIVPTEAVRRDLAEYYNTVPNQVAVVHHGVLPFVMSTPSARLRTGSASGSERSGDISSPVGDPSTECIPGRAGDPFARNDERVILYVGRLEYKKNVPRIVAAFNAIASRYPDLHLVLVGGPGHGYEEVRRATDGSPYRDRITTPGWRDPAAYHALLTTATVFCFPTLAEGFGMPILEAMAAGVPVMTSRGGAQEEVAGDAALLVNPTDDHSIASGMERILRDGALYRELVHRGEQRAAEFTWERCAQATWQVIASVLSH